MLMKEMTDSFQWKKDRLASDTQSATLEVRLWENI